MSTETVSGGYEAYSSDIEPLLERISLICKQNGISMFFSCQTEHGSIRDSMINLSSDKLNKFTLHQLVSSSKSIDELLLMTLTMAEKTNTKSILVDILSKGLDENSKTEQSINEALKVHHSDINARFNEESYGLDIEPLLERISQICKQKNITMFFSCKTGLDSICDSMINMDSRKLNKFGLHRAISESKSIDDFILKIVNMADLHGHQSTMLEFFGIKRQPS